MGKPTLSRAALIGKWKKGKYSLPTTFLLFGIMVSKNIYAKNEVLDAKMKMFIVNILFLPKAFMNCSNILPVSIISLLII